MKWLHKLLRFLKSEVIVISSSRAELIRRRDENKFRRYPPSNNRTGKPINTSKYPLVSQAYNLCHSIEDLPASEKQTALVTKASELLNECWNYFEEDKTYEQ